MMNIQGENQRCLDIAAFGCEQVHKPAQNLGFMTPPRAGRGGGVGLGVDVMGFLKTTAGQVLGNTQTAVVTAAQAATQKALGTAPKLQTVYLPMTSPQPQAAPQQDNTQLMLLGGLALALALAFAMRR